MLKEQYLTSIASFVYKSGKKAAPELKAIFTELPENMAVPAVYFPDPEVLTLPATLSSERFNYSLFIKIIAISTEAAYEIAAQMQREICVQRCLIPILNQDSTETGLLVRVDKPQIKKIDIHTYQLLLRWNENVLHDNVDEMKRGEIEDISFSVQTKND